LNAQGKVGKGSVYRVMRRGPGEWAFLAKGSPSNTKHGVCSENTNHPTKKKKKTQTPKKKKHEQTKNPPQKKHPHQQNPNQKKNPHPKNKKKKKTTEPSIEGRPAKKNITSPSKEKRKGKNAESRCGIRKSKIGEKTERKRGEEL